MSKTFRQADSRWGGLVYTKGGSTMKAAGCGPTSMAEIIVNNPTYKDADPRTTRKWLMAHNYNRQGTLWEGITKGLEHFGFKVASPSTMDKFFELMDKGVYKWGIINFKAGSRGGITWTSGGHYVAFSDYKIKDGKHYLYTRDPGGRHNDGWHCYETQMRGLIKKIWCCYLTNEKKTVEKKYDSKVMDISEHQKDIAWDTCPTGNVIVRSSYTSTGSKFKLKKDIKFTRNMKGVKGRKVGIYHFSQAKTPEEARKEAQYCLGVIKSYKKQINLPIAIDWEFNDRLKESYAFRNGKKANGKIIDAFCSVIKAAGYEPMVYANSYTLKTYLPDDLYKRWKIWVAEYPKTMTERSTPSYSHKYYLWQYTSKGRVLGISGYVDMDKFYVKPKETPKAPDPTPAKKLLKVGSKIKIKKGACQYGSSKHFADFVYERTYKVKSIAGVRVAFETLDGKTVIGAVSRADCIVQ